MKNSERFQIVTDLLVLAFLVFNAILLYYVWGQLRQIEDELADAREAIQHVKTLASDLQHVVKEVKSLKEPAKDLVKDVKEKIREVKLDDVLKGIQIHVDRKQSTQPTVGGDSGTHAEDGTVSRTPQP